MKKLRGLEISTAMGCRLNCDYCPQNLLLSRYFSENKKRTSYLTMEGFKKALESVEEGGFISFCGMVEPFHNPECADMIVYAYEHGYRVYLFTTLMGMTLKDFETIKNVKFDFFELHIADEQERCHFTITEEYKILLKKMQETFDTYTYCCHGDVHHQIQDVIDSDKVAGLQLGDRAGNLDIGRPKLVRKAPFICAHGFEDSLNVWIPVMLPDGTLVACCNDYGMRHQLGNLIESTWEEISAGEEYKSFRGSWDDNDVNSLCNSCASAIPLEELPAKKLQKKLNEENPNVDSLDDKIAQQIMSLRSVKRFIIWGTGNYFLDHYEYFMWDETLKPVAILDSNKDKQGREFGGVICTDPTMFEFEEGDMVVIFAKNAEGLRHNIEEMGLEYMMVDDLFALARRL